MPKKKYSYLAHKEVFLCNSLGSLYVPSAGSCETFNPRYFQLMFAQVTILDKYMISTVHEYMNT